MPRKTQTTGNPVHAGAKRTTRKPQNAPKASRKAQDGPKAKAKKTAGEKKPAPSAVLKTSEGLDGPSIGERPRHPGGRPSDYHPEYVEIGRSLADQGWTDQEMADYFGIGIRTFYAWKNAHPEFRQAIKLGKDEPDNRMELSLFHRGKGYEWEEEQAVKLREESWVNGEKTVTERVEVVKVRRQVPPDTAAAVFWLKNRRGWRDKTEVDHGLSNELAALLGQIDGNGFSL